MTTWFAISKWFINNTFECLHSKCFSILQSCNAHRFAKFYVTDHSTSAISSCHKTFAI